MGSLFGGGGGGSGGGGGGGTQSGTQVVREAPEIESRKIALYDQAVALAGQPVGIPPVQVAAPSPLQLAGFQQAGTTGVGQPTVGQGIASLGTGQQFTSAGYGAALAGPQVSQFVNPFQSFITDEINRQTQMAQNQLSAQAVGAGAFGGGRQGVAQAELERARLGKIGELAFSTYGAGLEAAQRQQALAAQTGLQAGAQFGQLGATAAQIGGQQQAMQQADISSLLQAGGVQQQLGQAALEAQRQTQLQAAYEPYQRVEFLKNIMTNLPTSQSSLTQSTAPGTNFLAQLAGAGIGAYTAFRPR